MKKKAQFNEEFIYDSSAIEREVTPIEPRFGAFLLSSIGSGKKVLDVGCGTGRYTIHTLNAGNNVIGSELVLNAAKGARSRGIQVIAADSEAPFPFPDESFDALQFIEVVEHLMEPVITLREMNRVLKPNGDLFISTPNAAWWAHRVLLLCGVTSFGYSPTYPVEVNMHIRHFTFKTLREFLERSGFSVVKAQGTFTGFPGALAEYSPPILARVFNVLSKLVGGLGFLAKNNIWLSLTSAGIVYHAKKVRSIVTPS